MPDNRRFGVSRDGQWLHYVGDCGAAATFLESRSASSGWIIVMFLDALFRSFGQLILANNPLSGAVLLSALCAVQPWAGLTSAVCAAVAVLVAAAAGQQRSAVSAGLASCPAALLGAATVCLLGSEALDYRVWTLLVAGAVVSVYVTSALSTLVSAVLPPAWYGSRASQSMDDTRHPWTSAPGKGPWPPLFALPYGLLQIVLFLCLMHSEAGLSLNLDDELEAQDVNASIATPEDVNATRVREFYDIDHLNWGQVVALEDPALSAAIYIALLLFSPLAACSALAGAFLGSMAGVVLLDPPFSAVYRGLWGVNGLLSMWAVGAYCFVLSWHSVVAGVACVALGAGLQAALGPALQSVGLPALLLPHSVAALTFLLVASSARTAFVRPAVLSFPEKHKYDFWTDQKNESESEHESDVEHRLTSKRPASPNPDVEA